MPRLGTVFVELNIDDKVFKQKLSEELTSTQTTAKGIEQVWKHMGVQNDATFDAQRRSYENGLKLIKASSTSTANDIVRAEKAKNEQIARLNEMQFGKQTSMLSTLKSHWLAVTAAITAAIYTIGKAWDMVKEGAGYEETRGILNNLTHQYSMTADTIVSEMRRASNGMIANVDLMNVALEGLAKGLKPEQLINLADAAKILSDVVGTNATTALNDLTEALETGRTRGLKKYIGTALDLEAVFGELYSKLTEAEKAQAMYSLTMVTAIQLQQQQTGAVDDSADKIEKLEARFKNLTTSIAIYCKQLAVAIIDTFDFSKRSATMSDTADGIAEDVLNASKALEKNTENVKKEKEAVEALLKPYQDQIDALKRIISARKDNEEKIKSNVKALKEEKEEYLSASEYQSWYWETTTQMVNDAMEEREKAMDKAKESTEELTSETTKQFDELQRAIEGWGKESADAIVDFCLTGKTSFTDMIQSMIADLMKMLVYQQMVKPLFDALGSWISGGIDLSGSNIGSGVGANPLWGSAEGNVFDRGNVIPFGRGGVVSQPTIFPMANGTGLMGEVGPEAVLPLKRTSGGNLGVAASAGQPIINIEIINQSKSDVSVKETSSSDGMSKIIFLVKDIVSKDISGGGTIHNSLRSTFGASPKVIGR